MSDRLITDAVVRRLFQIIVLGGLSSLLFFQILFLFCLANRVGNWSTDPPFFQGLVVKLMEFPFDQQFASLAAVIVGIVPMIVAVVCFKVDATKTAATQDLNRCGHIVILLLAVGLGASMITIVLAGVYPEVVETLIGQSDDTAPLRVAVRNTLSAILAFQAFYLVQLLGLKK
jgi:hypothetical protein